MCGHHLHAEKRCGPDVNLDTQGITDCTHASRPPAASAGLEYMQVEVLDEMPWDSLLPTSSDVTDAHMACTETLVMSLKCFSALLSLPSILRPRHIQFLGELLRTYSAVAADSPANAQPLTINFSQSAWHASLEAPRLTDLVQALKKSFEFLASLIRGPEGVLDHDLLVVRILRELCCVPDMVLTAAGVSHVGVLEHLPTQQRRVRFCAVYRCTNSACQCHTDWTACATMLAHKFDLQSVSAINQACMM